jgi:L-alanine-DL-glutamate epimerase-like enolase superfamily enzyme
MALYDILGKTGRKPLFMLMGGYRSEVMTDITLGIKSPKEMAKDSLIAVQKGFKALKVKVGTNPSEDVERVKMVREAVGSDVELRVDANQAWTPKEAMDVLTEISKCNVEFVEQPVSAEDVRGLASVRKHSSIPVMADESVHSPADALRLIRSEAVDMINIKLMKSGGIHKARKIVEVAEAAGVPCMIGCMSESELGITAAVHLAAAMRNIRYADLDSDLLLRDKLVKNTLKVENSVRPLSSLPGLGVKEIDQKRLGAPVGVYR